jgi:hypothetical protein
MMPDMTLRLGKSKKTGTGCKRDPLQPRKGMKKVSASRKPLEAIYEKVRARVFEIIPFCCTCRVKPAKFIHHLLGRQGAKWDGIPLLVDPFNMMPVCENPDCHPERGEINDQRSQRERDEMECYHNRLRELLMEIEPLAGGMKYRVESLAEAVKREVH